MAINNEVKMGKMADGWKADEAKQITFIVTQDCNLRCKYCYITGKNTEKRMSYETAKVAVDFFLSDPNFSNKKYIIWDFIGGEPFLEIGLIDRICDYIKIRTYELNHRWFDSYRFLFSTNGTLYHMPQVQEFIRKNHKHLSINITIDGSKYKHDLMRIYPGGEGSYDIVAQNYKLWNEQFPWMECSTKATFAHEDLPHLAESIISLWTFGLTDVMANVVLENVWLENDDKIFEEQLKKLADYIIENKLWHTHSVRFFSPNLGHPLVEHELQKNFCGTGTNMMVTVDADGTVYPCLRFIDCSLNNRKPIIYGNIFKKDEFNYDVSRRFAALDLKSQSPLECLKCEVASDCAFCTAHNYDAADTATVFQRSVTNCNMHKANVRANEYFWRRYQEETGKLSPYTKQKQLRAKKKYLMFITGKKKLSHCYYEAKNSDEMNGETVNEGLKFAIANGFVPVFLGNNKIANDKKHFVIDDCEGSDIVVFSSGELNLSNKYKSTTCIYRSNKQSLSIFSEEIFKLMGIFTRINVRFCDIDKWGDADICLYKNELKILADKVLEQIVNGKKIEIDVLTDRIELKKMKNCDMGENSFALAPNGKLYLCPATYFDNPGNAIGDLEQGIIVKNEYLMKIESAPICSICDAYHCTRCKWLCAKRTGEYNVPSKNQCVLSHVEREISASLSAKLIERGLLTKFDEIPPLKYYDPMELLNHNKSKRL